MELYPRKEHRASGLSISREKPAEQPISEEFLREFLKISHSKQAGVLQSCIDMAEAVLFEKGQLAILQQPVTVAFEYGGARARFPNFPVREITQVKVKDESGERALQRGDDYEIINQSLTCVELNQVTAGQLTIQLNAGYASGQAEVKGEHGYLVANLAGAYYLRDNKEIEKQLNEALASMANV